MEKIKSKLAYWVASDGGKDILTVAIMALVGLGSFGLGRLSKNIPNDGLRIEYDGETIKNEATVLEALKSPEIGQIKAPGAFFASSKGSKYYSLGCSAGKTIKLENRVYFDTREQAESAGYELSASCR